MIVSYSLLFLFGCCVLVTIICLYIYLRSFIICPIYMLFYLGLICIFCSSFIFFYIDFYLRSFFYVRLFLLSFYPLYQGAVSYLRMYIFVVGTIIICIVCAIFNFYCMIRNIIIFSLIFCFA